MLHWRERRDVKTNRCISASPPHIDKVCSMLSNIRKISFNEFSALSRDFTKFTIFFGEVGVRFTQIMHSSLVLSTPSWMRFVKCTFLMANDTHTEFLVSYLFFFPVQVVYFLEKAAENVKGLIEKMRASVRPPRDFFTFLPLPFFQLLKSTYR